MKTTFEQFMLDNGIDKKSVPSYFSYVNKSFENFLPKDFNKYTTIYDRLLVLTKRSRVRYCEYLISRLNVEINSPISSFPKKTLKNYKSGVTLLKRFVDSGIYAYNGKKQFSKIFSISYSQDELIDNFVFRIETQDRIYKSKNCFPCRLFGKIFGKTSMYRKQYEDMLSQAFCKTKFLVNSRKDYALLEQIDRLDILGGIKIWSQGQSYDVFTDAIHKGSYKGCVKTTAKLLEDLSLDHDEPLEIIVNREIFKLPELKRLSDAFWNYHKTTKLTGSKLTTEFYDNEYAKLNINESTLLGEIINIYKYVDMTIMDKKLNSALGNRIIVTSPIGNNITTP